MNPALDTCLRAPTAVPPRASVAEWWPRWRSGAAQAASSAEQALLGGFDADRVGWAEQVSAALAAQRPLGYGVEVGVVVNPALPQDLQDIYNNRGISPPRIEAVDLRFTVQGLHEVELAEAVEQAVAAGGGIVRVERCRLARRPDGIGLDAECDLRRYAMPAGTGGNEPAVPDADPEAGAEDTLTAGVGP